jgi:hypothetical protein
MVANTATEMYAEWIEYLKLQIEILIKLVRRDSKSNLHRVTEIIRIANATAVLTSATYNGTQVDCVSSLQAHLRTLASMIDKNKGGGWIADKDRVFRVMLSGHQFIETDVITITKVDEGDDKSVRRYHDGFVSRAREVAGAMNTLALFNM